MQIAFHRLFGRPLVAACLSGDLPYAARHAGRLAEGRPAWLLAMLSWAPTPDYVAEIRGYADAAAVGVSTIRRRLG